MSSQLLIESFCYGNIKLFTTENIDYQDQDLLNKIYIKLRESISERDINSLWNIIYNIQNNINLSHINFFIFVRNIFNILDDAYYPDYTKIGFDNLNIMKSYLINDINFFINAYSASDLPVSNDMVKYYQSKFKKEQEYIDSFGIITQYSLPGDKWEPEWVIKYNQNVIKTSNIDIYLDNIFVYPNINYASNMNDILEKMITRLTFLKNNCNEYYKNLERYLYSFSLHVFNNFPYYEVSKYYQNMIDITDNIYIPDGINKEDFKGIAVMLHVIPPTLSSYILGFPCISMGSLSQKLLNKLIIDITYNEHSYFKHIEEKNNDIIKSQMFVDTCANGIDDGNILNLLYNEVKTYNSDDVKVIMSNGVYFVFTYPEFENIWNTELNPYNRSKVPDSFITYIKSYTENKKKILSECRRRGLKIKLEGTMQENFEELMTNIKNFNPNIINTQTWPSMGNFDFNITIDTPVNRWISYINSLG